MKKVVVVGSLNIDLTVYTEQFPAAGETVVGRRFVSGMGGKGCNQATAAHRAGAKVCMVARMGTDSMAEIVRRHFTGEGMSMEHISVSETSATGIAVIEVEDAGQNRIIIVKGCNEELSAAEVDAAAEEIASADVVLTQLETGWAPILRAKELANAAGVPFVVNPAPYQPMPAALLVGADWMTPNETEASSMCGLPVDGPADAPAAARAIRAMGVKNVLITLGAAGAYAQWTDADGEHEQFVAAPKVQVVDTTGAGDAFNGAFAVALAEGKSVPEAMRFAACCGSLSVTKPGTAPAMPCREEIDALAATL